MLVVKESLLWCDPEGEATGQAVVMRLASWWILAGQCVALTAHPVTRPVTAIGAFSGLHKLFLPLTRLRARGVYDIQVGRGKSLGVSCLEVSLAPRVT